MEHNLLIFGLDNQTSLLILMGVLILFIVLLTTLSIVFIIALRKRRPVVKVVMAPQTVEDEEEEKEQPQAPVAAEPVPAPVAAAEPETETVEEKVEEPAPAEEAKEEAPEAEEEPVPEEPAPVEEATEEAPEAEEEPVPEEPAPVEEAVPVAEEPIPEMPAPIVDEEYVIEGDEDDDEGPTYITEGHERVRYNRSFIAKLCQLSNESKEWYSAIKNDILSYNKVKARMSWKRESFRLGRMTVARLIIRGKTLCLLLAVEPAGYSGTKYKVEDVSNVSNTVDTPTLYRIKSARRLKYAMELVAGLMTELKVYKKPSYESLDYFVPYEGDMALIQKGLIKRVITGSTRTFKIEEIDLSKTQESTVVEEPSPAPVEVTETETEVAAVAETELVEETVEEVAPVEEATEEVSEEPIPDEVTEEEPVEEPPQPEEELVEEEPQPEEQTAPEEELAEEVSEEVIEGQTATEEQPEEELAEEEDDEEEPVIEEDEDESEEALAVVAEGETRIRYNRSFTAKLSHLNDDCKGWYSSLKNDLLSYKKVKARMSWKRESFRLGRVTIARLVIRGRTLCLLLASDPNIYADTKYKVQDVSGFASTADTPTLYRIKNARRFKYAKELIANLMEGHNISLNPKYEVQDFIPPYEDDETLIQLGLIKVNSSSASTFIGLNANKPVEASQETESQSEIAATAELVPVEENVEENVEETSTTDEVIEEVTEETEPKIEEEVAEETESEVEEEVTEETEPEAEEEVVEETKSEVEEEVTEETEPEAEEEVAEETEPEAEEEVVEETEPEAEEEVAEETESEVAEEVTEETESEAAEEVTEETEPEAEEEVTEETEPEAEEEVTEETEPETEEVSEEEGEKFEPDLEEEFVYVHGEKGDNDPSLNTEDYANYNSNFMEKYNQLSDEYKEWYSDIKNDLLSYGNIRVSSKWKSESHHANHSTLVRLVIRNNTIYLLLAANPDIYAKYEVQNLSKSSDVGDTPTLYGIKSELQLANAKEMIEHFMHELNIYKPDNGEN